MANKTTNFALDLPTGDELFNPLWPNSNTTKIDAQMKKNMDNSVTKADCVFNTNKFIITREDKTGKIFKFIAPNDYVAGYTFTVDGTAMDGIVAGTGDALADGCFMNGHEVIAYIDETTARVVLCRVLLMPLLSRGMALTILLLRLDWRLLIRWPLLLDR